LEAQGEEAKIETDPTNSLDEDYHPIPQRPPPRAHDSEAGGSHSTPPPQTNPALIAILNRMQPEQARLA
jgi:hypothetical protein